MKYKNFREPLKIACDPAPLTSIKLTSSDLLASYARQYFEELNFREQMFAFYTTSNLNLLGVYEIGRGSMGGVIVDHRLIFTSALLLGATRFYLVHNHPGGNTSPSMADIRITKEVVTAGKLMSIRLVDHLTITADEYCSMGDDQIVDFD